MDEDEGDEEEELEGEEGSAMEVEDRWGLAGYEAEDPLPVLSRPNVARLAGGRDPLLVAAVDLEEVEDEMLRGDDLLLLAGVAEGGGGGEEEGGVDVSHLDLLVWERPPPEETEGEVSPLDEQGNCYVHHDVLLPAFPLAVAWMDFPVGATLAEAGTRRENLVAVSTMEPHIEVWDLDVLHSAAPLCVLGGAREGASGRLHPWSHKEAVLSLAWHAAQRTLLASGSADTTVKLWELEGGRCVRTLRPHSAPVQALEWHQEEAALLASGGFDGTVVLQDVRDPQRALTLQLGSDVEALHWVPHAPRVLVVALEDGRLLALDAAQTSTPLWSVQAHTRPVQALAVSPVVPGLLATGSADPQAPLRIWDVRGPQPSMVHSASPLLGQVHSLAWHPQQPFVLALGGGHEKPRCLDHRRLGKTAQHWGGLELRPLPPPSAPDAMPSGSLGALLRGGAEEEEEGEGEEKGKKGGKAKKGSKTKGKGRRR